MNITWSTGGGTIQGLLGTVSTIFGLIIPIIVTLALIYFLWGVAQYVMHQGDEQGRTDARQMMINGIIALFVLVSVWGLVRVLGTTFNINQGGSGIAPGIVTGGGGAGGGGTGGGGTICVAGICF